MLSRGSVVPDFHTLNHRGEEVRSQDLIGTPFLLWFYPKASTSGCTLEGQRLTQAHPELAAKGLKVFGVSFDSVEDNAAFAEEHGFPFDLLCDTDRELGVEFGACDSDDDGYARRISYLVDENGIVFRAYEKVDPAAHADQVLADLAKMLSDDEA